MTLGKLKVPAVAAAAVLMVAGASNVFAATQTAHPAVVSVAPAITTAVAAETPAATDADNVQVQSGDQTTPDTNATGAAGAIVPAMAVTATGNKATLSSGAATGAESATETSGETGSATEADGPGGHADPAGNVDHQFNGEE